MKISSIFLTSTFLMAVNAFAPVWKKNGCQSTTELFYDIQRDPPNDNVWNVLANTEKWISATLQDTQQGGNPLSRKEVSYVCETSQDSAMVLANIFRKLKEARQMGEAHAQEQEELADASPDHERATLRQTQVLVVPSNEEINNSFHVFDNLINAINNARRNARDYVTDVSLERLDESMYGDGDRDWSVSVSCAHLHPKFGEKTPEQELKEMKEEEEAGEVDLNLQEYKRRRLEARRSPYPSVVVEVRAMVPPNFSSPTPSGPTTPNPIEAEDEPIDSEIVQNLEALFAKSSLNKDGGFYDSIGSHIETVNAMNPMSIAQQWVADNDPDFDISSCAFTLTDTAHVDEAYEFVFTNLAMQTSQFGVAGASIQAGAQKRQYLVMPHFVTSSATSLEKFAREVESIMSTIPSISGKVRVGCFHPEHIQEDKRCSVPVFILQWID